MIHRFRFLLVLVAMFAGAAEAVGNETKTLPDLSVLEVIKVSDELVRAREFDHEKYVITSVTYFREFGQWRVTYNSGSLVIGGGMFQVILEDKDPTKIRIESGL